MDEKAGRARGSERVLGWGVGVCGGGPHRQETLGLRRREDLTEQKGLGFSKNLQCHCFASTWMRFFEGILGNSFRRV